MTRKSNNQAGTFSAFLSASDEAEQFAYATRQKETGLVDSPAHGANAEPSEETTLERRVLAHQRILQALICDLADDDPAIFERLNVRFGVGHDLGSYEQDYVTTGHYCEHFLGSVEQRHSPRPVTNPKIAIAFEPQKVGPLDGLGSRQVASDRGQREEWENEGGSFAVPLTPPRNACFSIFRADRVMLTSTRPAGGDWRWKLRASTGALIAKGSGFSTEKECLAAVTFLKDNSKNARIFIE
jgi:uncharacterized protein YegP (UPF0339 family)